MKMESPWVRASRLATVVLITLPAPVAPITPVVLEALLMSSATEAAVISEVAVRRTSLPTVCPPWVIRTLPVVVRLDIVISPLVLLVVGPVLMVSVMLATPVLMVTPFAIVIAAAPALRLASTTPFATVAFATATKAPLSVVMLLLMRILLPACRVNIPSLPAVFPVLMASLTVISLFACSVTAVPPLVMAVIKSASKVASAPEFSANWSFVATALAPPLAMMMFFGSNNTLPASP